MNDIIKIVQALEDSNIFLLKGVSKTIINKTKEQRGGILSMLLGIVSMLLLRWLFFKLFYFIWK